MSERATRGKNAWWELFWFGFIEAAICSWRGHHWQGYQFLGQEGTPYCRRCGRWRAR